MLIKLNSQVLSALSKFDFFVNWVYYAFSPAASILSRHENSVHLNFTINGESKSNEDLNTSAVSPSGPGLRFAFN